MTKQERSNVLLDHGDMRLIAVDGSEALAERNASCNSIPIIPVFAIRNTAPAVTRSREWL